EDEDSSVLHTNPSSSSSSNASRLNRRQKASSSSPESSSPNPPDLLAIPGVGPRNFRKLVQKGIQGVAQLKQLYKDKFIGKSSDQMV
ncbi:deoxycytidine kinase, partial [Trifolium medium]|nr:deoxycytidine kinase [Trifolium medium]